jgi:DNA-binding response OmpR family regulator
MMPLPGRASVIDRLAPVEAPAAAATRSIIIVADDLIWASRLRAAVERTKARPTVVQGIPQLEAALADDGNAGATLVDLNGRSYDGVEAVRTANLAGHAVLAVGQHEDLAIRKRALEAGARRVLSYNKLFNDGPAVVAALLDGTL